MPWTGRPTARTPLSEPAARPAVLVAPPAGRLGPAARHGRSRPPCGALVGPGPGLDLRPVLAVVPGVGPRRDPLVGHLLPDAGRRAPQPGDPVDHVHHQAEAV